MSNLDEQNRRYFTRKTFHAEFTVQGMHYEVAVDTPELLDAPKSVWGDWGPMFTCRLAEGREVVAVYRCADTGEQSTLRFRPKSLRVLSPPRFETRARTPFYLEFLDEVRGLCFRGYMNDEGRVVEAVVFPLHPRLSVHDRLFDKHVEAADQMVAK